MRADDWFSNFKLWRWIRGGEWCKCLVQNFDGTRVFEWWQEPPNGLIEVVDYECYV